MAKRIHGKVDLTDWSLPSVDDLIESLSEKLGEAAFNGVREALEHAFDEALISFAVTDDHKASPLEIDVNFTQIASNEPPIEQDDSLTIRFSLSDALSQPLKDCEADGSYSEELADVRDALRVLSETIDTSLKKAPK